MFMDKSEGIGGIYSTFGVALWIHVLQMSSNESNWPLIHGRDQGELCFFACKWGGRHWNKWAGWPTYIGGRSTPRSSVRWGHPLWWDPSCLHLEQVLTWWGHWSHCFLDLWAIQSMWFDLEPFRENTLWIQRLALLVSMLGRITKACEGAAGP
jgi:hypothetical protein